MIKDENCKERRDRRYKIILETRKFEIETYWKRSIFFWGFVATAFVSYGVLKAAELDTNGEANGKTLPALLTIGLAWFGFICSFAWALVNRGSKYWQDNWENLLDELDQEMTGNVEVCRDGEHKLSKIGVFKERQGANRSERQGGNFWSRMWNIYLIGGREKSFSVSKVTILLSDVTVIFWFIIFLNECMINIDYNVSWVIGVIGFALSLILLILMFCGTRSQNNDNKNK